MWPSSLYILFFTLTNKFSFSVLNSTTKPNYLWIFLNKQKPIFLWSEYMHRFSFHKCPSLSWKTCCKLLFLFIAFRKILLKRYFIRKSTVIIQRHGSSDHNKNNNWQAIDMFEKIFVYVKVFNFSKEINCRSFAVKCKK